MSEKISFYCQHCSFHVTAPASLAGRQGKCPQCQQIMTIPAQSAPKALAGNQIQSQLPKEPLSPYSPLGSPPHQAPMPRKRSIHRREQGASKKSLMGLQPKTLGEIISESFSIVFSSNIFPMIGITIAAFLPVFLVVALLVVPSAASGTPPGGGTFFMVGLCMSLGMCFIMGSLVKAVTCIYLGESISVGECLRTGASKMVPILFALILMYLALIGFAMVFGVFAATFARFGPEMMIVLVICIYIAFIYFALRFSMTFNVIVVESTGALGAIKRSMELTQGSALRIFLVFLVVGLLFGLLGGVLVGGVGAVSPELGAIVYIVFVVVNMMIQLLVSTILYFDLRVRKESFGLQELANIFD